MEIKNLKFKTIKMKKLLLFFMVYVAGMTLPLHAQNPYYEDVVYLKNGTIIKGIIVEQIPNVTLKIKTREENIFVYKMDEVEKITKELPQQKGKTQLFSQKQTDEDVVYLKNGSVVRGVIIEQIPNISLKVQTREGNIFVYKMDEVEKISKELMQQNTKIQTNSQKQTIDYSAFNKPKGYLGLLEFGGGIGFGTWGANRISLTMLNGYRAVPQFAIGFGIGLQLFFYEYYDGYLKKITEATLPIFLHLRSDFLARKVSPFIAFNIGYNASLSNGFFGGIILDPTMGVSFNVGGKRMTVGANCAINGVKYYRYNSNLQYYRSMGFAFCLKVGYSFLIK
jgi:sRNA-binding regulator protein Hfq